MRVPIRVGIFLFQRNLAKFCSSLALVVDTCQQMTEGLHQRAYIYIRGWMVRLAKLGSELGRQRTLGDVGQKNKSDSNERSKTRREGFSS